MLGINIAVVRHLPHPYILLIRIPGVPIRLISRHCIPNSHRKTKPVLINKNRGAGEHLRYVVRSLCVLSLKVLVHQGNASVDSVLIHVLEDQII